jgi:hypothetical protein
VTERSKERTSRPRAKTHLALMEQRIVEALTERIRVNRVGQTEATPTQIFALGHSAPSQRRF